MSGIWWIAGILAGAALLLWLLYLLLFQKLLGRYPTEEDGVCRRLERDGMPDCAAQIRAGRAWYHAQPCQTWEIDSWDGVRLAASFLPASGRARGTVILCHGYRSMAAVDFSCVLEMYHRRGLDLLLIDQRAQGRSGGKWMGLGVLEARDLLCWTEEVNRRLGADRPVVYQGMSMGAATVQFACGLALPANVAGVVADCGFSSPWEICAAVLRHAGGVPPFPLLYLLNFWCRVLGKYDLRACSAPAIMTRNPLPVLWIHGEKDDFVPCEMSRRAYAASSGQKWLVTVPEAGHGMSFLLDPAGCLAALEEFLQVCFPPEEAAPAPTAQTQDWAAPSL